MFHVPSCVGKKLGQKDEGLTKQKQHNTIATRSMLLLAIKLSIYAEQYSLLSYVTFNHLKKRSAHKMNTNIPKFVSDQNSNATEDRLVGSRTRKQCCILFLFL